MVPHGREERCRRHKCGSCQADGVRFERPARACSVAKMALVLLSVPLTHAAWQDGCDDVLLAAPLTHAASVRPAPGRSMAQEREIYGVFHLVSHKVQYANPGLACTPDQAKSGCWTPQVGRWDEKTCRAVQGVRTVRGPVAGLRMNLWITCRLDPWPRRNSRPSHSS